jgi:hypothetical protein
MSVSVHVIHPQKLALTSLTSGGLSVSIVRSRTKAMEFWNLSVHVKRETKWYGISRSLCLTFPTANLTHFTIPLSLKRFIYAPQLVLCPGDTSPKFIAASAHAELLSGQHVKFLLVSPVFMSRYAVQDYVLFGFLILSPFWKALTNPIEEVPPTFHLRREATPISETLDSLEFHTNKKQTP